MKLLKIAILFAVFSLFLSACAQENGGEGFSGTYCLSITNIEMTIVQSGNKVAFSTLGDFLTDGTGTIDADTLNLTATIDGNQTFHGQMVFSKDRQSFSGPFQILNENEQVAMESMLQGIKGECAKYDIATKGIPRFIEHDFIQLNKVEMVSKFRSGFGHSFTDGFESCRSMKHYFAPYPIYRENNNIEMYSPVKGTIASVDNEFFGSSIGLTNKQIYIRPDDQPAFTIVLYHCDLVSSAIQVGKKVEHGELLGYARMYYDDIGEYTNSFDIAIWANTTEGGRLVSYFHVINEAVFNQYLSRGVPSREEFIISQAQRDATPLQCLGESFVNEVNEGNPEGWVILN